MEEPIIKLNGWKTIATVAKEKGCSTQYISRLIRSHKYHVREYPELNNLRLVKDKE
jgi:hypothetical protein